MTRIPSRASMVGIATILSLGFVMNFPIISRADTIYNAITLFDLNITGFSNSIGSLGSKPGDLLITGDAFVVDEDSIIDGNAFADQFAAAKVIGNNPNDLSLNDGLSQQAVATGNASVGTAVSFALTQGILEINNLSLTDGYTIDFEVDWSYFVDASVTNVNLEFATAASDIFFESDLHGSLLDQTVVSDADFGGGLITDDGVVPFSIFVAPGESDVLTLSINAAGAATAITPVPEPSALALFGIGLLGTAIMQWRQRGAKLHLVVKAISSKM